MLNRQMIIGHLGNDPEYKAGNPNRCKFRVASSERWTDKSGNKQEETEWFKVVMWNKLAEVAHQYLKKGDRVYIEGRTKTHKWTDENGVDNYITEVVGDKLIMLGDKKAIEAPPAPQHDPYKYDGTL